MAVKIRIGLLFLIVLLNPTLINAGIYLGLAPTNISIKTSSGSTKPLLTDFRLGYAHQKHKIEIAILSGLNDDNFNQLVTEIPTATSIYYRYTNNPQDSVQMDFILGYSKVDVKSSYTAVPTFTETYEGISFGIGFEEALKSFRQVKVKFDFVQLYRGDKISINSLTLGIRYVF